MIREANNGDWAGIAGVYNHYIANTVVTFEETAVDAEEIGRRVRQGHSAALPWLVAQRGDRIDGYAYASPWRLRAAYRFSVEVSAYLAPDATGRGLGTALYEALFADLERRALRTAIGGIALPNPASVALHEKFGMQKVAHFSAVGFKFGDWIDVGYWQGPIGTRKAGE